MIKQGRGKEKSSRQAGKPRTPFRKRKMSREGMPVAKKCLREFKEISQ